MSTEMFSSSSSIETSEETMESANCNCDNKLQECRDELSNNLAYEMFSKRLVNMLLSHITFKVKFLYNFFVLFNKKYFSL